MVLPDERLCALELSRRPGVGGAAFRALIAQHATPSAALAGWRPPERAARKAPTEGGLADARRWIEQGGHLLYLGGPGYPETLLALGEPPPVLFVAGDAGALVAPLVAVVGGRDASPDALAAARSLGRSCAEAGWSVVSGGARGIDGAALAGALEAGGQGVVVLGSGVDVVYPPEHERLFWQCQRRGALVSELLPGAPPRQSFFVTRNRIIAALGRAAVLVWGRPDSGALVTLRWARKLTRPCAALDWQRDDASARVIAQGATRLASITDAARWIGPAPLATQRPA